jgi:hypothetical protein
MYQQQNERHTCAKQVYFQNSKKYIFQLTDVHFLKPNLLEFFIFIKILKALTK